MRTRVLAILVAGFLSGVFIASVFTVSLYAAYACVGVALISLIVGAIFRRSALLLLALLLCAILIGWVRLDAARLMPDPVAAAHVGEKVVLTGIVFDEPDIRDGSTRLNVHISTINGEPGFARVLVVAPPFIDVQYGDTIEARGTLKLPEAFESGEDRSFNYPMYLAARRISYQVSFAQVKSFEPGGNPLKHGVLSIKSAYINGLRAVLPEPYAGLASGITAGDKRSVGSELTDVFQRVSLIHILVLSGYNITTVLGALMIVLTRFSRGPRLAAVLIVVSFFYIISGGAASAARAGAMAFAAVFAKLYGRQFAALRVLMAIVFLMVLWNPYLLAFDPGFQLSVLATLGLVLFASHVERFLIFLPTRLKLREIAAATCSTQLTVLPLLLYQNGMLSIVSLPANLLALVAVPAAMAFTGIAALAGIVFGTWGTIFALPAYVLLRYIIEVANLFGALPFAAVSVGAFSGWWLVPVYGALAAYAYVKRNRPEDMPPAERVTV